MIWRLLICLLLFASCRVNDMACPTIKAVKLNKKPENYMRAHNRTISASDRERDEVVRYDFKNKRSLKSAANIEEWDCPRPGSKTPLPKAVRDNIKKNRKKFEDHYKNRSVPDSLKIHSSIR